MHVSEIAFETGIPKVQQIADRLAKAIADGTLPPGTKLPSLRELTQTLGVSKFTVIDALDRLRGRNLIVSRQGRGYFVAARGPSGPAGALNDLLPQDFLSVLRRMLISPGDELRPGCGFLPESWLDSDALRQAMRQTVRAPLLRLAEYGVASGYLPLRQALQEKLACQGLVVPAEQIVTTANTMQAVDMLLRLLLSPGDTVLLDDPCYFNFHSNLTLHGARVVTVARGPEGPDLAALEQMLHTHRPCVYLTSGLLHNPTGRSFLPAQAFRLLQLARQYGCHVIEDDLYGDLHDKPPPRLAALAGVEQVSYVSGFSKILTANARVSYVAASPRLAAALTHLKLMSGGVTCELLEQIVYRMLVDGSYGRHCKRIVHRLLESGGRVAQWLLAAGCTLPFAGEGGMFHWARLPDGIDSEALARAGLRHGLVLAPGSLLSRAPDARRFMRFNVAYSDDDTVRQHLLRALDDMA
ncbi:GntR family transcriptional regulator [Chitiniphilus shinanonensis]|uniref:Putative 8-amino-7-oxononanoate synthase n=1 Tax=Chitiniphilus shinanonensis TaxID=553088 RepID=A0ABQ6BXR4_9NEIS|nr:PLP-dependent aminotransferase family protein [Chitiniphilus shinanonensis]GLS05002.1 GntR family transcriptional regulator [Chitiniphilus shinanonensis]